MCATDEGLSWLRLLPPSLPNLIPLLPAVTSLSSYGITSLEVQKTCPKSHKLSAVLAPCCTVTCLTSTRMPLYLLLCCS